MGLCLQHYVIVVLSFSSDQTVGWEMLWFRSEVAKYQVFQIFLVLPFFSYVWVHKISIFVCQGNLM